MEPQTPSSLDQPIGLLGKLFAALLLLLFALAGAWLVAGFVSLGILANTVPLLASDLHDASWLGSPTTALHFFTGPVGFALSASFALLGAGLSLAKRTPVPLLGGVLVASAMLFGGSEEANVRIGLLDGTVRIGCYVPESRECAVMLGLPTNGTVSRYPAEGDTAQFAAWYREKRDKVVSPELSSRAAYSSIPGGALLRAPLYFGASDELARLVKAQRLEVAQLRTMLAKVP